MGHSQQVQYGIGATTHGNVKCHSVEESLAGGNVSWQHALVAIFIIGQRILHYLTGSRLEQFYAIGMRSQDGAVARQGQTNSLGQRIHGVGSEHT